MHAIGSEPLSTRRILQTWWPLAATWLLMTVEIPALTAIVARTANPEVNLAAWGVAFPTVLILAAPAIALLASSTTLSKDWDSFLKIQRYAWMMTALMTGLHALLAFSPFYDLLAHYILAMPPELFEPVRTGMRLLMPFIPALAYRRYNYGVLIRFGHSQAVTLGAVVRLSSDVVALTILYLIGGFTGIAIATITFASGVVGEAIYANIRMRPVLHHQLKAAPPVDTPITLASFVRFYLPLVMTTLLGVLMQSVVNAALTRMPNPIESLAAWPVVYGLISILRSAGIAYVEAVVVLLDAPQALIRLRRFTFVLALSLSGVLLLVNSTPLAVLWFRHVVALPEALIPAAQQVLWFALPLPGMMALDSWFQGMLLNSRQTRAVSEAVLASLIVVGIVLGLGIVTAQLPGLLMSILAMLAGACIRSFWLWRRTRTAESALAQRDLRSLQAVSIAGD